MLTLSVVDEDSLLDGSADGILYATFAGLPAPLHAGEPLVVEDRGATLRVTADRLRLRGFDLQPRGGATQLVGQLTFTDCDGNVSRVALESDTFARYDATGAAVSSYPLDCIFVDWAGACRVALASPDAARAPRDERLAPNLGAARRAVTVTSPRSDCCTASEAVSVSSTRGAGNRLKQLRALAVRPHSFVRLRALALALTVAGLAAPALTGMVGLDLWDGRHRWLGRRTDTLGGVVSVLVGIAAFYLVTFVVNAIFGRLFCGFGCPSAQLARAAENVENARATGRASAASWARGGMLALALSAAGLTWLVHPAILVAGSPRALAWLALAWLGGASLLAAHGHRWRWRFCRTACPIGAYYTVVQTTRLAGFGIHHEPERAPCRACTACVEVCPVALDPRRLHLPLSDRGGALGDGYPGTSHCLTCGDCVRTCELVRRKRPEAVVPLRLGFRSGAHRRMEPDRAGDRPRR